MMDAVRIVAELRACASRAGLTGLAIGPARPLEEAARRLRERVAKGFAGHYGLTEGSEERFCRPDTLLPGAKSVICCALSYLRPSEPPAPPPGGLSGVIARFARGRDYHLVMREKLSVVEARLKELVPGCATRILCDTGPLMDRAAALASGLAWAGKNACVFTGEAGSWVVLGEIVTDVELPFDEPSPDHRCGSCELCLAACPTGAIVSPFEIDLNRCISHLTQMSGIIPRELRPLMGTMIYGCDICQEVCPQNAAAVPGDPSDFEPGPVPAFPDLIRLLEMTQAEFETSLKRGSPGWIGRNRLRRNACVALGNIGDPSAVPALLNALHDPSTVVRAHAAWALGRIGDARGLQILQKRLTREPDPDVLEEIRAALG
jgi:epoxyqueuosine reductase